MKNLTFIAIILLLSTVGGKAQEVKKAQPDSLIKIIPFGEGEYTSFLYTIGGKLQTANAGRCRDQVNGLRAISRRIQGRQEQYDVDLCFYGGLCNFGHCGRY